MLNIVYDVDDVLNNLNDYVFNTLELPMASRFNIRECSEYTKEQQDTILDMYGNVETFKNLTYVDGAKDICEIEKTGKALVWINSSCFTKDIADFKVKSLLENIPGLNPDRIILQIGVGHKKKQLDFTDIIVEDCLTNMRVYKQSTSKLLINKIYNQPKTYCTSDWKEGLIRVPSLLEANKLIRSYVERN